MGYRGSVLEALTGGLDRRMKKKYGVKKKKSTKCNLACKIKKRRKKLHETHGEPLTIGDKIDRSFIGKAKRRAAKRKTRKYY